MESPLPVGTRVKLDERATLMDRDLLCGGSPWRLLRLSNRSRTTIERWREGGEVRSGEERLARTLVQYGFLHAQFDIDLDIDEIEVVIPHYDQVDALARLLSQLDGFHVTVVDDGSQARDAVARLVSSVGAKLLCVDKNAGPARARNVGAATSTRRFVWFIDADVSLFDTRDVAQRLRAAFEDDLVAAVSPRIRGVGGPSRRDRFEIDFSPLDMGARSAIVVPGCPVGYVPAANLLVRRAAFGDGFDEALRVGEDVDFVWRLFDRGWQIRYDATAFVGHPARSTWPSWWRQRQAYGASSAKLARRHGARLAPLRIDTWTLIAWLTALAGQPAVSVRVVLGARNFARDRFFSSEDDPSRVADAVVTRNMLRAGGPLARAIVRTFGVAVLMTSLNPRLRWRAFSVFALGTAWRWRHQRIRPGELALGMADDLGYGVGVIEGAWRAKTLRTLTPEITKSVMGVRDMLGSARSRQVARSPRGTGRFARRS